MQLVSFGSTQRRSVGSGESQQICSVDSGGRGTNSNHSRGGALIELFGGFGEVGALIRLPDDSVRCRGVNLEHYVGVLYQVWESPFGALRGRSVCSDSRSNVLMCNRHVVCCERSDSGRGVGVGQGIAQGITLLLWRLLCPHSAIAVEAVETAQGIPLASTWLRARSGGGERRSTRRIRMRWNWGGCYAFSDGGEGGEDSKWGSAPSAVEAAQGASITSSLLLRP